MTNDRRPPGPPPDGARPARVPTFEHASTALMERPSFDDDVDDVSTPGESLSGLDDSEVEGSGDVDGESTDPNARLPRIADHDSTGRFDLSSLPSAHLSEVDDGSPSSTAVMAMPRSVDDDPATYAESVIDPVEVMKWRAGPTPSSPSAPPPPLDELEALEGVLDVDHDGLAVTLPAISLAAVAAAARAAGQAPPAQVRMPAPSASGRAVSVNDAEPMAPAPSPSAPPSLPASVPLASPPSSPPSPPPSAPLSAPGAIAELQVPPSTPPPMPLPPAFQASTSMVARPAERPLTDPDVLVAPPSTPAPMSEPMPMPLPPPFGKVPVTTPLSALDSATVPSLDISALSGLSSLPSSLDARSSVPDHPNGVSSSTTTQPSLTPAPDVTSPTWSTPRTALVAAQAALREAQRLAPEVVQDELRRVEEALVALEALLPER